MPNTTTCRSTVTADEQFVEELLETYPAAQSASEAWRMAAQDGLTFQKAVESVVQDGVDEQGPSAQADDWPVTTRFSRTIRSPTRDYHSTYPFYPTGVYGDCWALVTVARNDRDDAPGGRLWKSHGTEPSVKQTGWRLSNDASASRRRLFGSREK